jgi:hypothetical protein
MAQNDDGAIKLSSSKYSSKENEHNNNSEKSTTIKYSPGESFKRVPSSLGSPPGYISEENSWSTCCADEVSEEVYMYVVDYYFY